ncbi:type II secretion system protein F [Clostridia bacterium]|nr:type II secretion system protein F [Clostridia bacterium]
MPKFQYTATTTAGTVHTGVQDAPDGASLLAALRGRGMYATQIKDVTKVKPVTSMFTSKIKVTALSMFCSQMATVLRAGVPLATALEIMHDQVEDQALKKILADVAQKLQIGRSLTEAFTPFQDRFPQMFINMLEAGEASGALDQCLRRAGDTFTKQAKMNSKIKAAMAYPMVLLGLTLVITVFLIVFIIPQFAETYAETGTELPAITTFLLGVSSFVATRWLPLILGIAAVIFLFRVWLNSDRGRTAFDMFKLKLPIIGKLQLTICAGRYTRTLSTMNAAGVPLTSSLEVTARSLNNRWLQKKVESMIEDVRMGSSLTAPLERMNIFPKLITHMTRLGEESGSLDELLEQSAVFYEEESDNAIAAMTAMMEPAIIVIMGVLIGTVVLGIMQPMFGSVINAGNG